MRDLDFFVENENLSINFGVAYSGTVKTTRPPIVSEKFWGGSGHC